MKKKNKRTKAIRQTLLCSFTALLLLLGLLTEKLPPVDHTPGSPEISLCSDGSKPTDTTTIFN